MFLRNSREFLIVSENMYYLNIIDYFSPQDIVNEVVCKGKKIKKLKTVWKEIVQNTKTKNLNFRIL